MKALPELLNGAFHVRDEISSTVTRERSKANSCKLAHLALTDTVIELIKLDELFIAETNRPGDAWSEDVEIAKHVAHAVKALTLIAEHLGLDAIEVLPQRACTLCGRASIEWRRDGKEVVCILCRNDDDFDVRVRRVQRELTALSVEHGDAEKLGEQILSGLGVCDGS